MNVEKNRSGLKVSEMAENLSGSEIIKLAADVNQLKKAGAKIHNLTIGDFDPDLFPIPSVLKDEIIKAYEANETNYPPASGTAELRSSISTFLGHFQGLNVSADKILVSGGARPLIYAVYKTVLDPGDKVLFPVPSWNNNHYSHLNSADQIVLETRPENSFMPTPEEIEPFLAEVSLIALCSPLNPTGTVFKEDQLKGICELIIKENHRRGPDHKPVYLLYDQIYWTLTYGGVKHVDPVTLVPEMENFTIYIDGLSKAFAATGVRVGWAFGPSFIINKMASILGHIGAWAPKAEQMAVSRFLDNTHEVEEYLSTFRNRLQSRLEALYKGFLELKEAGFNIDAIAPAAAIYLTVKFDLPGLSTREATKFLLEKAGLAIVPFYAFGTDESSKWYRISVGTVKTEEIREIIRDLKNALSTLNDSKNG